MTTKQHKLIRTREQHRIRQERIETLVNIAKALAAMFELAEAGRFIISIATHIHTIS